MKTSFAALLATAGLILTGCAQQTGSEPWTGGPTTPPAVRITVNPSALPIGDAIATGMIVKGYEMLLYIWHQPTPYLSADWRDVSTGAITENDPVHQGWAGLNTFYVEGCQLAQFDPRDGTIIEVGCLRGPVARITSEDHGTVVEAKFTRWSADPEITIFWLRRDGGPYPSRLRASDGSWQPGPPEQYPLITAYDTAGKTIIQARLRPEASRPLDG
jgi:hypothetical protein